MVGGDHSSGAGPRAGPGGRGAVGTATAPPRRVPGDRDLRAGAGAARGGVHAGCYATAGDVRRLSLVPKVTGRAAGPGTICVCPQRGCGASGVWRSGGNALLARGQAGDRTQRPFQLSEAGDPGGAASAPYGRTPLLRSLPPRVSPHA